MSEGPSSLQPSPYMHNKGNGIKISPTSMMPSNETNHSGNNCNGNLSNSGNSNDASQSVIESRQDNQSLSQNNHQNQSRSNSTAMNLTMNMSNTQSQSHLPGTNEELPPRTLFSPSPDKAASSHNDHNHGHGHGHNHQYDRDNANINGNSNSGGNSCINVNVNNNTHSSHQLLSTAHLKSSHSNGGDKVSSSPSHSDHGLGEGSMPNLQHSHSNKPPTTSSRSNMALSSNHTYDRPLVTNESSSSSSLYGRRDHDSYGGLSHTTLYGGHTGCGRRYPYGHGHGYDDSYQHHNHHDHHNQRLSSNDEYYDPHQNTKSTANKHVVGGSNSTTGPVDAGVVSAPGVNNSTGGGDGGGTYPRQGMQASRLAYEQNLNNDNNHHSNTSSHHHKHHQPSAMPSAEYQRYGNERRKEEIMKHYHPPQASPSPYDRYGHRPSTRFEMDHRRLPLLDIGGTTGDQRTGGGTGTSPTGVSNTSGGGHSTEDNDPNRGFDGRNGVGYHASPAVAISRRGGTKRSPFEQSEHIFPNDHHSHPSPPNISRNSSAVRYCTPIVTGSERSRLENGNLPQGGGQGQDNHLHHHAGGGDGGFGRAVNNGGPSPPSSRYDDHHDSHLRYYHRPYPSILGGASSSPPRYTEGSPQHHHHNTRGSPSHYNTPLSRVNSARERPYYDPPHPHMPLSHYHREKENYSYPTTGGYHHPGAGYYSPYGNPMTVPGGGGRHIGHGHLDYRHSSSLHNPYPPNNNSTNNNNRNSNTHSKNTDSIAAPPQKKQRRVNADPDKPKTKSAAANKPPRRKKMYSDYVGVTYNKTHAKFQACITHYRKQHYLGRYKLAVDAARAYDKSAKELKGDGWKINFQNDEEYEKAKLKEISDTEKKKAAAAAKLIQEQEALELAPTVDQQPGDTTSPTYDIVKLPPNEPALLPLVSMNVNTDSTKTNMDGIGMKHGTSTGTSTSSNTEHECSTTQNMSTSSKADAESTIKSVSNTMTNVLSSAVTPSPHAQNLNKMNQASLMNEPLISPLPKVNNANTPLVRKSVFSPSPVKQTVLQSDDTENITTSMIPGVIEQKNMMSSSNHSSDMSIMSNNIFSSPLEKQEMSLTATVTETKKSNSLLTTAIQPKNNVVGYKKERDGYVVLKTGPGVKLEDMQMPKVEEDENAAQALLMIRK